MEIEFIQNLEKYCIGLQSSKNNEREASEQCILSLMKTPQPYKLCFNLLAKSNLTIAHFYALLMIRDSAIREWAALDSQTKLVIIETLFQYIENISSMNFLNYATKGQSFNTLGVIIKRGWLDTEKYDNNNNNNNKGQMELNQIVMDRVYQYIDSGLPDRIEISIKIIGSLIIEFSSSSKAAHIQLSWEFHQKCLITFQNLHLQPIFRKVLELLQHFKEHIQQVPSRLNDQSFIQILYTSVKVFTDILDWRFLESGSSVLAYITSYSGGRNNLKPTTEWSSLFTVSNGSSPVASLVFGLYQLVEKVEKIPNLLRHAMSQLCSLQGPIIKDTTIKNQYLSEVLTYTTKLIEKAITTRNWNEMEDISNIIYRFCNTYKFSGIACLSNNIVIPFLQYTTQFVLSSLNLMKIWAKHGEEELEEEFENDCFDILLRSFVAFISDAEMLINRKRVEQLENFKEQYQILKQCTSQIYQNYIQSRLELSEIEINKSKDELEPSSSCGGGEDEIDEDKKKYDEQLRSIAYIGRLNPGQSLELLKNEINRIINLLRERISDPILFESLHWLLIFAGHLIFDAENKSPSAIPNAIEDYTFEQCNLTPPNQPDSVIDLCNAVFRFHMEYENPLLNNGKVDSISPLVSQTSLWFTSGWVLVYLLPSNVFNVQISPKIIEAYGSEQPVLSITDYFINKILLNLKCWSGDIDVLKATSNLLNNFTTNKELCKYLVRSPNWSRLFFLEGLSSQQLPPSVYGQLFKAFSRVVFSFPISSRKDYFIQLVKTLVEQMDGVLGRPDFTKISQEAKIKENIYILLEKLNGIVSVSESEYVDDDDDCLFLTLDLFTKYATSLIAMIPLYDHCNDIVLLILRLFSNLTKHQLEFLNQDRARSIFPLVIQLFNAVTSTSSHKKTLDSKEYYHRVRIMVKILTNIITFGDQRNNCPIILSETVFHGINIITPCLSNNDLLLYPKLARNYFMITTYLFGSDSIEVKNVPVINTIYSLIEAGILHHDLEIVKACFECIGFLTKNLEKSKEKSGGLVDPHYQGVLVQFIGSVINFLLLQDFNVDELLSCASETLFSLMYSSPDGYRSKVIELITRQDPSIQSRVLQQFETLTIAGTDRKSKDLFMKNLQTFLVNVKSLINKK
ncbi:hypothetical protein RB653_005751 [Dictyostelium firmibasis]|uniref:Exportin-4 n=1 Tax=Dictyostelium firmibasis TaxID=79012 RepID=A0AAN7U1S5_9MYCE